MLCEIMYVAIMESKSILIFFFESVGTFMKEFVVPNAFVTNFDPIFYQFITELTYSLNV